VSIVVTVDGFHGIFSVWQLEGITSPCCLLLPVALILYKTTCLKPPPVCSGQHYWLTWVTTMDRPLQGVVGYASPVGAFATGIKNGIKWSAFYLGAGQGIKTNSERLISMHFLRYQGGVAPFLSFDPHKIKQSRAS